MKAYRPDLLEMCRQHFNEPMLVMFDLARCIGYAETAFDCYVITQRRGGKAVWATCVGGYYFLDRLNGQNIAGEWDDLKRLDYTLELNGAPKAAEFTADFRHDDFEHLDLQSSLIDGLNKTGI